jgi:hypothetical protein
VQLVHLLQHALLLATPSPLAAARDLDGQLDLVREELVQRRVEQRTGPAARSPEDPDEAPR